MAKRRRFGRIRQLPSGRWQARYHGADGVDRPAPATFRTKADAEQWLIQTEADILSGRWTSPDGWQISLQEYAAKWITERPGLRPRTVELYRSLLRLHIAPGLGDLSLAEATPPGVRQWRADLLASGVGEVTVAKAYRLLKAVFATAVEDEIIRRNPCRIPGASTERVTERPTATLAQVFKLADGIDPRFRALVLLGTFTGLRWGEAMALRRRHVDLSNATVRVEASVSEVGGQLVVGPPKTPASVRTVAIPSVILPDLRRHLETFAERGPDGRVFVGAKGATLRRGNWAVVWRRACKRSGVTGLRFHDLRHTGNTLAASTGASLRELMTRMGHSSTRAALIYQHATSERDRLIAAGVDELVERYRAARPSADRQGVVEDAGTGT